jgi:hypothetical protein
MAKIKTYTWKGRKVFNMRRKSGKTVMVYTNKHVNVPQGVINLGPVAFRQWIDKNDVVLVKCKEKAESISYSLVTKLWFNQQNSF